MTRCRMVLVVGLGLAGVGVGCGGDDSADMKGSGAKDASARDTGVAGADASHRSADAGQQMRNDGGQVPRDAGSGDDGAASGANDGEDSGTPPMGDPCEYAGSLDGGSGLIENGGFELPALAAGYQLFTPGQTFPGWEVVGASGNVAPLHKSYTAGALTWPPHSGDQTLDLTGLSNTATGVSQTVSTDQGRSYALSFWTGNIVGGTFGTKSVILVSIDGERVLAAENDGGAGTNTLSWKHFCVTFTAESSSTAIEFLNGDAANDNSNILDDVALQ